MMIRLRGGGHGAGAGKTSRVEICNAVVDRARARTAWTRSAPANVAVASTAAAPRTRQNTYRAPHRTPTASPGAAAWA